MEKTLSDPHSWGHGGRASFQRIDTGVPDFRVTLTSSLTVRKLCGYDLPYETSCYNGDLARVVINDARWVRGAVAYKGNLARYRLYVINHEVGHALGNGHVQCPRNGALAPVMMQQTLGVTTPGVGTCTPNPYPYPVGTCPSTDGPGTRGNRGGGRVVGHRGRERRRYPCRCRPWSSRPRSCRSRRSPATAAT